MFKKVVKWFNQGSKDDSKEIHRPNLERNKRVVEIITKYNNDFSETTFGSWVFNVLLRYIKLCSNEAEKNRLVQFENIHIMEGIKPNWHSVINFYNDYKSVNSKFVEFTDYVHTDKQDTVFVRALVACTYGVENSSIDENDTYFFNIQLTKQNNKSIKKSEGKEYTSNCPSCGAPTKINTFGICDHCQELISIYDNVWKIRNITLNA